MIRAALLALCLISATACKKDAANAERKVESKTPSTASASTGVVGSDGLRRVAIIADKEGYKPERIAGTPGEKLMLVFTRTADSSCIAQLKAPDGKLVDLPMNTPVEVAVTVPQTGEVGFACGMDMFHGVVVAQPKS